MKLIKMPLGIYQANCYIIWDEESKKTAVIDPGGDFDYIKQLIQKENLTLEYIILTHGHADHIGAVLELKEFYNPKVLIHKDDNNMLKNKRINYSDVLGKKIVELDADVKLENGDEINVGNINMEIIHTPGHSKGSICIKTNNILFTGDTLFAGSIGRTDLEGGSFQEIISSIKDNLLILPDETIVYPGHGPSSTIAAEKANNPFLK